MLQNFKIYIFASFLNFDFVLFWLGIWRESLVGVIMGQRGVSQNAGVLVVLVASGLGLVLSGNRPLPEAMLISVYHDFTKPQSVNSNNVILIFLSVILGIFPGQGWGQIRFIKYKYKYKNFGVSNINTNTNTPAKIWSNTNTNTNAAHQIQIQIHTRPIQNCRHFTYDIFKFILL